MITANDVFRKIKELSVIARNPRVVIPVSTLSTELLSNRDTLIPCLVHLKDLRLINFDDKNMLKLTLLGMNVNR
jgi:hypothetical protein